MVNNQGYIIYKLSHKKGRRRHDYDVYKTNHHVIPKDVVNMYVLGYLGVKKDFPEQMSALPYRKKKIKLSEEEKEYNKIYFIKRIVIEHTICRLNKYRIPSFMEIYLSFVNF